MSLPALATLWADSLDPDGDLSNLACSIKRLSPYSVTSPRHLLHLSLNGVEQLGVAHVHWTVGATFGDTQAAELRRAAKLLARLWAATPTTSLHVGYDDASFPPTSQLRY